MLKLGLIGGIGSGKSTVAEMFCQLGAEKIDADQVGHQVLLNPEIKTAARQRWGYGVFTARNELDRQKLAAVVFADSTELHYLQSITHPLIQTEIKYQLQRLESSGTDVVLLDAPLLLESHWEQDVHRIIFVDAPRSLRRARVSNRGWTPAELDARESAQLPLGEKRRHADWIISNSKNLEKTLDQVKRIWQNLLSMTKKEI